jgi:putative ATP-dependent endonuclease of the OLD family
MRIVSAEIRNYRPFRHLPDTPLSALTVFIGANDVGKSAFLRALDMFFNGTTPNQDDWHKRVTSEPIMIDVTFDSEGLPTEQLDSLSPLLMDGRLLKVRKAWSYDAPNRPVWSVFRLNWDDPEFASIQNLKMQDLVSLLDKHGITAIPSGSRLTNEDRMRALEAYAERTGITKSLQPTEVAAQNATLLAAMFPKYSFFDADTDLSTGQATFQKLFQPIVREIIRAEKLQFGEIEGRIKTEVGKKAERLSSILTTLNRTVSGVTATPRFNWEMSIPVDIEVEDIFGHSAPAAYRGAGLQRTLMLAAFRLANEVREAAEAENLEHLVYALEEPEVYLHPGAQRELFHELVRLSSLRAQVLITSHSTVFVDRSQMEGIKLVRRHASGETEVSDLANLPDISSIEKELREELGFRPSDMFYANCYLLVEG